MTTYQMTPINSGLRLRSDHTTFAGVIASFSVGDILTGSELWIAPADGSEVKAGDKWLFVTHKNGVPLEKAGWSAYIHKGVAYCRDFKEIADTPPTDPPPSVGFPQSYILTNDDPAHPEYGKRAEYQFVRVVE